MKKIGAEEIVAGLIDEIDWTRVKAVFNYYHLVLFLPGGREENYPSAEKLKKAVRDFLIAELQKLNNLQLRLPYINYFNRFELMIEEANHPDNDLRISLQFVPDRTTAIRREDGYWEFV